MQAIVNTCNLLSPCATWTQCKSSSTIKHIRAKKLWSCHHLWWTNFTSKRCLLLKLSPKTATIYIFNINIYFTRTYTIYDKMDFSQNATKIIVQEIMTKSNLESLYLFPFWLLVDIKDILSANFKACLILGSDVNYTSYRHVVLIFVISLYKLS